MCVTALNLELGSNVLMEEDDEEDGPPFPSPPSSCIPDVSPPDAAALLALLSACDEHPIRGAAAGVRRVGLWIGPRPAHAEETTLHLTQQQPQRQQPWIPAMTGCLRINK